MLKMLKTILSRIDDLEPNFEGKFSPNIPDNFEDDDVDDDLKIEPSDLSGISMGIQYCDTKGNVSNRRITCLSVKPKPNGDYYIYAKCHERKHFRSFLYSRITEIIDWDTGEIHEDKDAYFYELFGKEIAELAKVNFDVLAACRPGLTFLTAVAYADGRLDECEIDKIMLYCDDYCSYQNIMLIDDEFTRIRKFISRYNPTEHHLNETLRYFSRRKNDHQVLLRHANKVANSDGVLAPEEFELILELDQ